MIKIRNLLNDKILNDKWFGYSSESEFVDENGKTKLLTWTFLKGVKVDDECGNDYLNLDDKLPLSQINGRFKLEVLNDNGLLCIVELDC